MRTENLDEHQRRTIMRFGMKIEGIVDHIVMRILWSPEALVSGMSDLTDPNGQTDRRDLREMTDPIELRGWIGQNGLKEWKGWNDLSAMNEMNDRTDLTDTIVQISTELTTRILRNIRVEMPSQLVSALPELLLVSMP